MVTQRFRRRHDLLHQSILSILSVWRVSTVYQSPCLSSVGFLHGSDQGSYTAFRHQGQCIIHLHAALQVCIAQRSHCCQGDRISLNFTHVHHLVRNRTVEAHMYSEAESKVLVLCIVSIERRRLAQACQVLEQLCIQRLSRAGQEKGEEKVDIIQKTHENVTKNGEQKRWTHGDDSVGNYKDSKKHWETVKTPTPFLARYSQPWTERTSENGHFSRRSVVTFSNLLPAFSDTRCYSKRLNTPFLGPRSESKGPSHALEKLLTNETPCIQKKSTNIENALLVHLHDYRIFLTCIRCNSLVTKKPHERKHTHTHMVFEKALQYCSERFERNQAHDTKFL